MTLASRLLCALFSALLAVVLLSGAGAAAAGCLSSSDATLEWVAEDDAGRTISRGSDRSFEGDWAFDEDAGLTESLALQADVHPGARAGEIARVSVPGTGISIRGPPSSVLITSSHVARLDTAAPSVPPATRGSTGTPRCSSRPAIVAGPAALSSFATAHWRANSPPDRTADTTPLPYGVVSAVALALVETSAAPTSGGRGSP